MREEIKVLLVDDHPALRAGLRGLIEDQEDLSVVAEAVDGAEAVVMTERHHPDVILMDVVMFPVDGIEATARITAVDPNLPVLMISADMSVGHVAHSLRAGAVGYLVKGIGVSEIAEGIRKAYAGELVLSDSVRRQINSQVGCDLPFESRAALLRELGDTVELATRELQVLRSLAEGMSNQQIAQAMYLSEGTVKSYLSRAGQKLGSTGTRDNTLVQGVRQGLVEIRRVFLR